jgi:hypothetical protein
MTKDQTENERAPMCKICEHRHWNREPHVFARDKKKPEAKPKPKPKGRKKKAS